MSTTGAATNENVDVVGSGDSSDSSGDEEYEVEQILEMKTKRGKKLYLVKWKNYGPDENSWEPQENLEGAKDILKAFLENYKEKMPAPKKEKAKRANKSSSTATPRVNKRTRKGTAESDHDDGDETKAKEQSSEDESDDDAFSPAAAKKKKKGEKKSKKGSQSSSAGATTKSAGSSSSARPAPHSGDTLTMAINRRMNYGVHSSWLDSDEESESDNNKAADEKNNELLLNGNGGGGEEKASVENGGEDNSASTPATEKVNGDLESPDVTNNDSNEPSEHDPPALSTVATNFPPLRMNGTTSKKSTSGKSTPSRSTRASKEKAAAAGKEESAKEKPKEKTRTPGRGKPAAAAAVEVLKFDGAYLANDGMMCFVAKRQNGETSALTYEEAKTTDASGLCDFFYGKFKFIGEKGANEVSAPQLPPPTTSKEADDDTGDDDNKLNLE